MSIFLLLLLFNTIVSGEKNTITIDLDKCILQFREYTFGISVGKIVNRHSVTPDGSFEVLEKSVYPPCNLPDLKALPYNIDKKNPYGKFFIRTSAKKQSGLHIGIHGTNNSNVIGKHKYISSGCIRMKNEDLEKIYGKIKKGDVVIIKR